MIAKFILCCLMILPLTLQGQGTLKHAQFDVKTKVVDKSCDSIQIALAEKRENYRLVYSIYDRQLPNSYICGDVHVGNKAERTFPYVFNARPVISFTIFRPTALPKWYKPDVGILFMPEIRMLIARSKPVRTPSYHIGIYSRFYLGKTTGVVNNFPFIEATIFHHSNGQDAPEFLDSAKTRINYYNGNFSTNYAELMFGKMSTLGGGRIFYKAGLQLQNRIPGDFSDHLEFNYGLYRAKGSVWWAYNMNFISNVFTRRFNKKGAEDTCLDCKVLAEFERVRFGIDATLIAGRMDYAHGDADRRINAEFYARMGFYAFRLMPFLAVGYYGQDPYNVYYDRSYWYFRLGITTNTNALFHPFERRSCSSQVVVKHRKFLWMKWDRLQAE